MYHEDFVLSHFGRRHLRRQRSSRPSPHREECGERLSDYSQKCRAQCRKGHKESCPHRGLHIHAIVEASLSNAIELVGDFETAILETDCGCDYPSLRSMVVCAKQIRNELPRLITGIQRYRRKAGNTRKKDYEKLAIFV